MSKLNQREQKLLNFLRDHTIRGVTFTVAELSAATEYSEATVRTYLGKKLRRAALVDATQDGHYAASVPATFSEDDFRRLMTQVAEDPLVDILVSAEWKSYLSKVVMHGEVKDFRLTQVEFDQLVVRLRNRVTR